VTRDHWQDFSSTGYYFQQPPPSTPFFCMGQETFRVSVDGVYGNNRRRLVKALLQRRRQQQQQRQQQRQPNDTNDGGTDDDIDDETETKLVAYMKGGCSETRYDSDHEPLFRQESYFYYLTGVNEPDVSIAIEIIIPTTKTTSTAAEAEADANGQKSSGACGVDDGDGESNADATFRTTLFVPKLPPEYATIMGEIKTLEEWKRQYRVDQVRCYDDNSIAEYLLSSESSQSHQPTTILLLKGQNSDSGKWYEPPLEEVQRWVSSSSKSKEARKIGVDLSTLFPVLAECRVIKSDAELRLLEYVTRITSQAHAYVMRSVKSGMYEYQAESLFRHFCYYNFGARFVGYAPICGCGPNGAVLHYGHSGQPNRRLMQSGEMCLFDMGAEYFGYGSDVTCSFPIDGKFTQRQKEVYEAVLLAQIAVYDTIRPGVSWVDCHKTAEKVLLRQLQKIGIVVVPDDGDDETTTLDDLVEMRLGAVFMPHGLGHLIGIDTHDVGGYLPDGLTPPRILEPGLKSLRTARVLQQNMTVTVEPGCYFIDHLLDEALQDADGLGRFLDADLLQEYRGFGGVRLEDVVVVTEDGCLNYTTCPRTVEEVESVISGKQKWPPTVDSAPELRRKRLTDTNL